MSKIIINTEIYDGAKIIKRGFLRFSKCIENINNMEKFHFHENDIKITVPSNSFIIPGFINLNAQGGYNFDIMKASKGKIDNFTYFLRKEGITSIFPTLVPQSKQALDEALVNIKKASKTNPMIKGIHLKGPFINPHLCTNQQKKFILPANLNLVKHWQKEAGGLIKLVTFAPENSNSAFEAGLHNLGITLSVGYSNQSFYHMYKGKTLASHVTNLYNHQSQLKGNDPGVSGYALLTPPVIAGIIPDGLHVSPEMIKLAYTLKGPKGLEIITNSAQEKKENKIKLASLLKPNKKIKTNKNSMNKPILKFIEAFRNIQKFTGISREKTVLMSSVNQAHEFGLEDVGVLKPGKKSNFNILDKKQNLIKNFLGGEEIEN